MKAASSSARWREAEGLSTEHLVRVRCQKAELAGTEHCAGQWGSVFCLVDVRLPPSLRPHLTRWASPTDAASTGTPTAFLSPGEFVPSDIVQRYAQGLARSFMGPV
ncbi:hypothetical protein [Streptomyces mirabilis]|uniref:hypothetical protein n=1 Tax=Streptomyces mirabilis TaxID=68239 RepID=UPI00369F211C